MADTDVTTGTEEQGVDSLAAPAPPLAPTIAQNQIAAGQVNHGDSRDWAENMVSGVQAALAGFGAAGRVNPGSGPLAGVGAASRQALERRDQLARERVAQGQRQQALSMEQQRVGLEERRLSDAEKQNLVENARQQAEQVKRFAMDDAHLKLAQSHDERERQTAEDAHMRFVQEQEDYLWQLQQVGGGPTKIGGAESPEFDHYGDAEQWARANGLAQNAHLHGYIHRPVLLPNGKTQIWDVPDKQADWAKLKDANGKPFSGFVDPLAAMNHEEVIARTRQMNAAATRDYAQAKKDLQQVTDDESAKGARKALDAATDADGTIHIEKMKPGQIEQVRSTYLEQWRKADAAVSAATKEMRSSGEYFDAEEDPKKLAALEEQYGVSAAKAARDQASHVVTQLDGHAYRQPPPAGVPGGAPQKGETKSYQGANYVFDGTQWVRQQATPAAGGVGPPFEKRGE